MVGEHSIMDGTPTTRMCDEVLDAAYSPSFDHGPSSLSGSGSNPEPLDFVVNSALKERIAEAKKRSDEWVGAHTAAYYLTEYGKRQIKKYGVGPDAWTQMAIQLAYDRFCVNHGMFFFPASFKSFTLPLSVGNKLGSRETGGTYEAATARKFKKGRTEVIRVVTPEVRNWLAAMRDNGTTREERKALFMAAAKQHFMDAQDAGQGMGIDRHLFGLRMLVEEKDGGTFSFCGILHYFISFWPTTDGDHQKRLWSCSMTRCSNVPRNGSCLRPPFSLSTSRYMGGVRLSLTDLGFPT